MDIRELLKKIMDDKNITQSELADKLGITRAALWDRLNSKKLSGSGMGVYQLSEMMKALEYNIMLVPMDVNKPTGAIVI